MKNLLAGRRPDLEDHTHYHGVDSAEKHLRVDLALEEFLSKIRRVGSEEVLVGKSFERILYSDLRSKSNLPQRARSTRDGYAVKISRKSSPPGSIFRLIGDVRIGVAPNVLLRAGEAVLIATGSHIPKGANSVLMREYSLVEGRNLRATRPIQIGENILKAGEDISKGSTVLSRGEQLRAQHIALLTEIGIRKVRVFKKPRIAFFSTGDELIDAEKKIPPGSPKIFDSNRPFVKSLITELGAQAVDLGIAKDNYDQIKRKVIAGLAFDALILSAGSSMGERDYASRAIESIKGIHLLTHGVAMRPSSPTGLAVFKGRPVILLPGFPTSAIVSFFVFAMPAIMKISGRKSTKPPLIQARMLDRYEGKLGVKHYVRVRVEPNHGGYAAAIVRPTEAFHSSWMGRANGIAIFDEESSPVKPGQIVNVMLIAEIRDS
ncbi:MAG TPA: molybdopterin molybdotransferase MoeA [Nitrososphaerales archaeon]|nr:molybdopterin molybdotransferase MoeA [Nitrososphaerales archaeon]